MKDVGQDYVEIQVVDEETGRFDGFYIIDTDNIHSLSCATIQEIYTEFLHRRRYEIL
jgi:hypothetical protein